MTWLNTEFVPDNRAAYAAMERNDRAFEHSKALQDLTEIASRFPDGSFEREKIMWAVTGLAEAGPEKVAP